MRINKMITEEKMFWYISLRNYLREFTKRSKNFFHWSPLYWFLSPLKKNKIGLWTLGLKGLNKWEIFLPFHKLQLVKSLPFYWDILFFTPPPDQPYGKNDYDRPLSLKWRFLQVLFSPHSMKGRILTGPYHVNCDSYRSLISQFPQAL